ncbi:MAG: hypothetical protein ACD_83C00265G0002 [uncultured bacterium]|nr:MAG: hypothetical protein ACD_83C00265G0002 [uncultured bacterium]
MQTLNLPLTIKVFKEGSSEQVPYVAYNPEFDISSAGQNEEKAINMLKEAISIFLQGAKEDDNLNEILEEAGFVIKKQETLTKTFTSVLNFSLNA